jgi:hypothetical protein
VPSFFLKKEGVAQKAVGGSVTTPRSPYCFPFCTVILDTSFLKIKKNQKKDENGNDSTKPDDPFGHTLLNMKWYKTYRRYKHSSTRSVSLPSPPIRPTAARCGCFGCRGRWWNGELLLKCVVGWVDQRLGTRAAAAGNRNERLLRQCR